MKTILKIIYICIGLVLMNCNVNELSRQDAECYRTIAKAGKRIGQKYDMSMSSIGGGENNGIWLMSISFHRYGEPLTQEEARRLIIICAEEFLTDINSNPDIRPFLRDFPFSQKNIDVGIINYDPNGKDVFHPYIASVASFEGKITYATDSPEQEHYKSKIRETYEEALEKLKQESMGNEEKLT